MFSKFTSIILIKYSTRSVCISTVNLFLSFDPIANIRLSSRYLTFNKIYDFIVADLLGKNKSKPLGF